MDHPDQQVRAWFVHDYNTEAWIRGETAFYVMSADLATPMGGGVAAFEKRADAEPLAQLHYATVLNFDEMRAMVHVTLH
jgi:nitrous oxide reductase accessory protein NosL